MMLVEIGPGDKRLPPMQPFNEQWITVGPVKSALVDRVCDIRVQKLPFFDDSISTVYMSHVIEHIEWYYVKRVLIDINRVLKGDGVLELWTVDFEKLVQCYVEKRCGDKWQKYGNQTHFMTWINSRLFAYGDVWNLHKSCFDRTYLKQLLFQTGFSDVYDLDRPRGADHGWINMGVGAKK